MAFTIELDELRALVTGAGQGVGRAVAGYLADSDPSEWDRFIKVNTYGPMHVTRAALPQMIEKRWGRVITIVSDAGRIGEPGMAAYCAAKAGAAGFAVNGGHSVTL